MSQRIKALFISVLMLLVGNAALFAQEPGCDDAVLEAKRFYEAGDLNACVDRLLPCMDHISDRDLLANGYRLLSLSYLAMNENDKAKEYAVKLLKLKPDYQKFPQIDPVEFTKMLSGYAVQERLWLGGMAGFNRNSAERIKSYSAYESKQSYLASNGFQAGLFADYVLMKYLHVSALLFYEGISIQHVIDNVGIYEQHYTEEQRYFGLDLSIYGDLRLGERTSFSAGAGLGLGYMRESSVELNSINSESYDVLPYTLDATPYRNEFQPFLSGGMRISRQLGKGQVFLSMAYQHYLFNTLSDEDRYANLDFNVSNHYVNDDIRNRVFTYGIGYRHPILFTVKHLQDD